VADEVEHKIVERLKAEGDLIRNTGTNSLKSLRKDLDKFEDLFQSINQNLIQQTQILRATLKIQAEEARIRKSVDELAKAQRTTAETTQRSERVSTPPVVNFSDEQKAGGFLTSLAGLFGIGGIGGAAGAIGASLLAALRRPLRTALFTVLAPAIGTVLGAITEGALLGIGSDPATATRFGEAANLAGLWGMIGLAFTRRLGLIGAAAGAAASFGGEVLDAVGLDRNRMITILGQEMRLETLAQGVMGALGASMAAAVSSQTFRQSLMSFFRDSVGPDGAAMSRLNRRRALIGGTIGAAVLGAYITYGDDVKNWLAEQGMPEGFADTAVDVVGLTAAGASLGMMFGPGGAIVGAALGFAVGLGSNILNWLLDARDSATAEFNREAENVGELIERANSGELISEDERRRLAEFESEARRRTQLMLPSGQSEYAGEQAEIARGALAAQPLSAGEGITSDQMQTRVVSALEGNDEALNELLEYMRERERITRENTGRRFSRWMSGTDDREEFISGLMRGLISDAPIDYLTRNPDIFERWESLIDRIEETQGFAVGTVGFQDFGRGSFAVLHGREAVVPETTPAGQFLQNYFDENWQPLQGKIAEASGAARAITGSNTVIYAPTTVSPVTQVNRGGDSQVQMNAFGGGGRSDLDAMARPGGVQ
jgi:hypothetical protein